MEINNEYAEQILKERGNEYGDYRKLIRTLHTLMNSIYITIIQDKTNGIFKYWDYESIRDIANFGKTMMALKAARSIRSKNEAYKDCIVDFINYKKLTKEGMENELKDYYDKGIIRFKAMIHIEFDKRVFNDLLNQDNICVENVKNILISEDKND